MKKVILMMAMAGSISFYANSAYSIQPNSVNGCRTIAGWEKDSDGAWEGKNKTWYKLDEKANVWSSKDGKSWQAVKDGMWQDKDGKWLKIGDKKLWWSADGGKTWSEVPEWKWMGGDGIWYKFDPNWTLWINKM